MGLSQLYQLRGRVGRSNRIAYAYFTYQRDKILNEVAEKRLQAIKEFTELGSGFKIAMRDLSIRGAGNLLGAEQHGFIASVGFDLYSQMLAQEIAHRKAEMGGEAVEPAKPWSTQLELLVDAYLPSDYIYDSMQKIEIYKKVVNLTTLEEVSDLHEELVDRFGDIPDAVENLLAVARIKVYGSLYAIESITQKGDDYQIKIHSDQSGNIEGKKLVALSAQFENRLKVVPGPHILIELRCRGLTSEQAIQYLEKFLHRYQEVLKTKGELHNVAK
jgi:transcription-repair coupling factor (superfamily II helicase)